MKDEIPFGFLFNIFQALEITFPCPAEKVLYWYHQEIEHHPGLRDEMKDWRKWQYDIPLDPRLTLQTLQSYHKN